MGPLAASLIAALTAWRPSPGPQADVVSSEAFEVLYGGAAGGGKTNVLVNMARDGFRSALLIRRTFPQLEDSLVVESKKWYGSMDSYNVSKHTWAFPDGSRVRMGHLERDDDMYQYQGAEFDFIGVDELTQLNRLPYEYLISRLRTTRRGHRCRIVATSNPGGTGHAWVRERWAAWLDERHPHPAQPGELRWYARDAEGREVEVDAGHPDAMSRTFIPAKLSDNPYLGDDYRRALSLLPEPYRSQLLNGDWSAGEEDDAYQVLPTAWVKAAIARSAEWAGPPDVVGVDSAHGGDDRTVLAFARSGLGVYHIDAYPGRETPMGQHVVTLMAQALARGGHAYADAMPPSTVDIALGNGLPVTPVNFGGATELRDKTGQFRFVNIRAEMYWRLREAIAPEAAEPIALPDVPGLLQELTAHRWAVQAGGIKIEPKEDVKKRLGRSPDLADAVALAVWGLQKTPEFMW